MRNLRMQIQSNFEKTKYLFSEIGSGQYWTINEIHNIRIRPRQLIRWMDFFKSDLDYLILLDVMSVENQNPSDVDAFDVQLIYVLFNMSSHERIMVHLNFNLDEVIPTLKEFFAHAEWYEREQAKKLKIVFVDGDEVLYRSEKKDQSFDELPALRMNPNKSEEPYAEEKWIWKNYDLFSTQTTGLFSLQICFDPTQIVDVNVHNNFFHRGIENLLLAKSWQHVGKLLDPLMNGTSPHLSMIWYRTIEDLSDIKIPERAQALRIMLLELTRVVEHLSVMAEMLRLMNLPQYRYLIDAREKILELLEKYSGHRWGLFSINLGGVADDLPMGWLAEYQSISKVILKNLKIIHQSLVSSKGFRQKLLGPIVDSRTILKWGISGPAMRASGLNFDLRKSKPFYFYQDIDFDVPVGLYGTSYDRYLIRFEEIFQSFRILTQVLDNLPLGDFKISSEFLEHQLLKAGSNIIEEIWTYNSLETSNGENGLLVRMQKDFSPLNLKIKSSSFGMTQALREFMKGLREDQLEVTITSLGLKKSEIDR